MGNTILVLFLILMPVGLGATAYRAKTLSGRLWFSFWGLAWLLVSFKILNPKLPDWIPFSPAYQLKKCVNSAKTDEDKNICRTHWK